MKHWGGFPVSFVNLYHYENNWRRTRRAENKPSGKNALYQAYYGYSQRGFV